MRESLDNVDTKTVFCKLEFSKIKDRNLTVRYLMCHLFMIYILWLSDSVWTSSFGKTPNFDSPSIFEPT